MVDKNVEERIKALEESNAKLQKMVQKLDDTREIANLMGRYNYLHEVKPGAEHAKHLFAQKARDISTEVAASGVYVGKAGVFRRDNLPKPAGPPPDRKGVMIIHTLTTPVIEVAGDGKAAKGIWISPGVETLRIRKLKKYRLTGCIPNTAVILLKRMVNGISGIIMFTGFL